MTKIGWAMMLALVVLLAVVSGASARTATQYTCTERISGGSYSLGVIFTGSNQARLQRGCRVFAGGGFRLQWGVHRPPGWVTSAEYINPTLNMGALLIAPASTTDLIFRVANKAIFTQHGWILVRRG